MKTLVSTLLYISIYLSIYLFGHEFVCTLVHLGVVDPYSAEYGERLERRDVRLIKLHPVDLERWMDR